MFNSKDLCKLLGPLLRFDFTHNSGRKQLENALPPHRQSIRRFAQGQARADPGKPGSPPAIGCPATQHQATQDNKYRSDILDLAITNLEQLEIITDYYRAPDCHRLAQERLQILLAAKIAESWQAEHRLAAYKAYQKNAKGKPNMVGSANSR